MRRYNLQVLMPWDETWYPMEHVGPWWFKTGAVNEMARQALLFPRDHKFRIVKGDEVVYSEV